jgi:hypothetical protein
MKEGWKEGKKLDLLPSQHEKLPSFLPINGELPLFAEPLYASIC